ncbi:MAG: YHS domain-containing protein [Nitrospinae bacterium]|nr:YHS domain-containing protein [Nitrospinota bacterium]
MRTTDQTPCALRKLRVYAALSFFAFILALPVSAAAIAPVYSTLLGGAIRGYDPVAYFTESKPVEGKKAFSHKWKGATWYFASEKNRDLFRADPEKYAPRYGGYCAYAVSQGYTASIVPEAWKIVDGKLYLNFSKGVQQTWEQDIPGNIKSADKNWPGLLKGK